MRARIRAEVHFVDAVANVSEQSPAIEAPSLTGRHGRGIRLGEAAPSRARRRAPAPTTPHAETSASAPGENGDGSTAGASPPGGARPGDARGGARVDRARPRATSGSDVLSPSALDRLDPGGSTLGEVAGFAGWLSSAVAWAAYMIWAFAPQSALDHWGWGGDRYWALAPPALLVVIVCTYTSVYAAACEYAAPGRWVSRTLTS